MMLFGWIEFKNLKWDAILFISSFPIRVFSKIIQFEILGFAVFLRNKS